MSMIFSRHGRTSLRLCHRAAILNNASSRLCLQYAVVSRTQQFSFTPVLSKKKKRVTTAADEQGVPRVPINDVTGGTAKLDPLDEAYDFTNMERKILKAIEHMTHKLGEINSGGPTNYKVIEALPVKLDKNSSETEKLKDVAQVVTKGRHINIILNDEANIKQVKSAIQGSNLSLTPQGPTEDAPTTLTITVPPPTGESRQAALDASNKVSQIALEEIREARAQKHKKLRAMEVARKVRPDDLQEANKQMEQIVQRTTNEVKMILETHKKVISR